MAIDSVLGVIAHAAGAPEEGAGYFEDALTWSRKGNYRPELAWTCCCRDARY